MASLRPATRALARARQPLSAALRLAPKRFESSARPASNRDLEVGEIQGASFKIEPLRRVGEDPATMRARLLCAFPAGPPSIPPPPKPPARIRY
jgi:hypothetical protein